MICHHHCFVPSLASVSSASADLTPSSLRLRRASTVGAKTHSCPTRKPPSSSCKPTRRLRLSLPTCANSLPRDNLCLLPWALPPVLPTRVRLRKYWFLPASPCFSRAAMIRRFFFGVNDWGFYAWLGFLIHWHVAASLLGFCSFWQLACCPILIFSPPVDRGRRANRGHVQLLRLGQVGCH